MQHFIGCDLHTRYQVVAWLDPETGEICARRLEHTGKEVEKFYQQFGRGAVVGIEATIPALWFERLLEGLGHEWWVGDAAAIRAHDVRAQKYDERDARNIEDLLRTGRFPRIWVPSPEQRDGERNCWRGWTAWTSRYGNWTGRWKKPAARVWM